MYRALLVALTLPAAAVAAGEALLAPLVAGGQDSISPPWRVTGLPHQTKPFTQFSIVERNGSRVLRVEADRSYGNLEHSLTNPPGAKRLSWRWQVEQGLKNADLRQRSGEDMAVRVCALFDLPDSQIPAGERAKLMLARVSTGDHVPGATVCYVWDNRLAPDTTVESPYTRRIRFMVLRGPESPPGQWHDESRDIGADFLRLFGDESQQVPPLIGVAVGADSDNTGEHSVAYVSDVALGP
jgi:hypothetical protein